jgi:hypothetical protein
LDGQELFMSIRFHVPASPHPEIALFRTRIAAITSQRTVRPVVTRSGKRARGLVPSIKCPGRSRNESLLERDVLRVLEVSSMVRVVQTHPAVLLLPGDRAMHYTPDVLVEGDDHGALVETKATYFLRRTEARLRLAEVRRRLQQLGVDFWIVVETDVQIGGLQEELKLLLRDRPRVGRYRADIDPTLWDPLGRMPTHAIYAARWAAAQAECDALLARVMRRDPDELLSAAAR